MDFESEIKELKSQQSTIIIILNEILNKLKNNEKHDIKEKIKLFRLKYQNLI